MQHTRFRCHRHRCLGTRGILGSENPSLNPKPLPAFVLQVASGQEGFFTKGSRWDQSNPYNASISLPDFASYVRLLAKT